MILTRSSGLALFLWCIGTCCDPQSLLGVKYVYTDLHDWFDAVHEFNSSHVMMFAPEPKLQSFALGGYSLERPMLCIQQLVLLRFVFLPPSACVPVQQRHSSQPQSSCYPLY